MEEIVNKKEKWLKAIEQYPDIPIFMHNWWMDAVSAGKQWDMLMSLDKNGEVRAAMPYMYNKKWGMKYISMPAHTFYGGIWLRWDIKENLMLVKQVCEDFAKQLKELKLAYYSQLYTIGSPCADIMKSLGFRVKQKTAYRIEDLNNLNDLLNSFSKNKKKQLQKALALNVSNNISSEDFYVFLSENAEKKGKKTDITREDFLVLYNKAIRNEQGQLLSITDQQGNTLSAAFLVWDKRSLYLLKQSTAIDAKSSGAGELLVWEAIKEAEKRKLQFDFCMTDKDDCKQFMANNTTFTNISKYYNFLFFFTKLFKKI